MDVCRPADPFACAWPPAKHPRPNRLLQNATSILILSLHWPFFCLQQHSFHNDFKGFYEQRTSIDSIQPNLCLLLRFILLCNDLRFRGSHHSLPGEVRRRYAFHYKCSLKEDGETSWLAEPCPASFTHLCVLSKHNHILNTSLAELPVSRPCI